MIKLISCEEMKKACCQLVENIFNHDKVLKFVHNVTNIRPT